MNIILKFTLSCILQSQCLGLSLVFSDYLEHDKKILKFDKPKSVYNFYRKWLNENSFEVILLLRSEFWKQKQRKISKKTHHCKINSFYNPLKI